MENITEPLVTVPELYKRWTGLYEEEIAWGIRDAVAEIQVSDIRDFPTPYYLHKILFDASGKSIFVCALLTDEKEPFLVSHPAPKRIVFRLSDIEAYERVHPEVLYTIIPSDEGCDTPPEETNSIADLENKLSATQEKLSEAEQRIADLEEKVAATPQEIVTVDATLWEDSCKAACSVLVEVVGNAEEGITQRIFLERLKVASPGGRTHSKVDVLAWKALPATHKVLGRPSKK